MQNFYIYSYTLEKGFTFSKRLKIMHENTVFILSVLTSNQALSKFILIDYSFVVLKNVK